MDEKQESSELPADKKKDAARFNKKKCGMIAAVIVVIITLLVGINLGNSSAGRLREQLELGQKYLEEMKYEEAVVAFNNAIEIDPMNADAYLGLAEVYIRTGDFDTAYEYAAKGYELTGDERLKEKMDMIESGNITASNGWLMKESFYFEGELKSYVTHTYDLQGREKTTALYDGAGHLIDQGDCKYDEQGRVLIDYSLGWTGWYESYLSKLEREYDMEGNLSSCKGYDNSGKLMSEEEYDGTGRHLAKQYDDSGNLTAYQEYENNAEGKVVSCKWYDGSGNLVSYYENEWDAEGKEISCKWYDGSGNLTSYSENEYDAAGRRSGYKTYDGFGNLQSYHEDEYDAEGRHIGEKDYDSSGNLTQERKTE